MKEKQTNKQNHYEHKQVDWTNKLAPNSGMLTSLLLTLLHLPDVQKILDMPYILTFCPVSGGNFREILNVLHFEKQAFISFKMD